jgi:hypothetical protein
VLSSSTRIVLGDSAIVFEYWSIVLEPDSSRHPPFGSQRRSRTSYKVAISLWGKFRVLWNLDALTTGVFMAEVRS